MSHQWTPGRVIPFTREVEAIDETEATTLAVQIVALENDIDETEISVVDCQEK